MRTSLHKRNITFLSVVATFVIWCIPATQSELLRAATTAPTKHPVEHGRALGAWLDFAFEKLSAAPERDDPVMGMFILAEYYGEAGDADGVRKVLEYLEKHKQDFWSVERWPDDDPRFCKLPIACLRVGDRDAYLKSMELLRSTLLTRRGGDLVWRDLVHVYGMGGDVEKAINVANNLQEKSWMSEGLYWASYAADRNGHKSEAEKLKEAAQDAQRRFPDPYGHGTSPIEARLISDENYAPVIALLERDDWYSKSIGLSRVAVGQYFSGDEAGCRRSIAEAISTARSEAPVVKTLHRQSDIDDECRMTSCMWEYIAKAQWITGDRTGAMESVEESKNAIEPAAPFYRFDELFNLAGWKARLEDTPGALALMEQAANVARSDNRVIDSRCYAQVLFGLADAGDLAAAEELRAKVNVSASAGEIDASFAAGYAAIGQPDKAAAALAKVPRFRGTDPEPKSFMGHLFAAATRSQRLSQSDHALAVRRVGFGLAKSRCWDVLPAWIEALPDEGDRGLAALGAAEFLLRGHFADYVALE